MIEFLFDVQSKINSLTHLDPQVIEKKTDRWLFGGATDTFFHYQHPTTEYAVDLRVDGKAVQCPGCNQFQKQIVGHLKKDNACKAKCETIEINSFEKQLKAFKHKMSQERLRARMSSEERKKEGRESMHNSRARRSSEERKKLEKEAKAATRASMSPEKRKKEGRESMCNSRARRGSEERKKNAREEQQKTRSMQPLGVRRAKNRGYFKVWWKNLSEKMKLPFYRAKKFYRETMLGCIFVCCCCERRQFQQNVSKLGNLRDKVEEKKKGLFDKCIPRLRKEALVSLMINGKATQSHYICHACKKRLLKKQMPPMCAENGLKKEPIKSDDLKLTELERSMIALRIPFTKIVMLPKSRLVCPCYLYHLFIIL